MFTTTRQLNRYKRQLQVRAFWDNVLVWLEIAGIVTVFVFLCEVAYRLSFII